jgi:serine-type D-Ala-D-Ala carboxypeptidase/endopeptidase (penicillin-binding protein 4)
VDLGRPLRHIILASAALLAAVFLFPRASQATTLAGLQGQIAHELALAGASDGAYVYDISSHRVLFSERAAETRPPASVEKLYTATTALDLLGPGYRFGTSVLGVGHMAPGGVWEGSIYLHGGGDPTFGSGSFIQAHYGGIGARVSTLAEQLARVDGIRRITGRVEGDESYFDSLRGEPSSDFREDPFLEGTLSALAFNRGEVGDEGGQHAPAAYAAHELRLALLAGGVHVVGASGAATAPAGAIQLANAPSPTLEQLIGLMLPPSDNFFAETLVKDLGAHFGGAGSTAAGAGVVSRTISTLLGIHPQVVDGSGLSEEDRTSPYQVADLLVALYPTALGEELRDSMAVAGRSGTLELRMRGTAAAGRCVGKTGTLTGVSNLVGYCPSADGHTVAFAVFTDGIGIEAAHTFQDNIAITLADARLGSL